MIITSGDDPEHSKNRLRDAPTLGALRKTFAALPPDHRADPKLVQYAKDRADKFKAEGQT